MKRSPETKWLIVGFIVASLMMGWLGFTANQNTARLIESTNKSKQTHEIIKNLINIYATMTVAESGRRGYVFLGDEKELYRYQAAVRELEPKLQVLQRSLGDRAGQLQRLKELDSLLRQRVRLLQRSIQLYRQQKTVTPEQINITEKSVKLREKIQLVIAAMQSTEELSLEQWINQLRTSIGLESLISFWVITGSFGGLAIASILVYQQLLKRQQAEAAQYKLIQEKESNEVKLNFFSMVSHEFRTPLSVILASTQLLIEGNAFWSEDRRLKNLNRIQFSAKLMTRLLTDILTLTRAEAGKLDCRLEAIDVEAFCLNLVEEVQLNHANYQIKFFSRGQPNSVQLDGNLLYSILNNLLENAVKYSEPDYPILLTLICDEQTTTFQVQDQGVGIALEEQAKVFDLFYRGRNVGESSVGTGLGLAVVKKCVELHRGRVTVASEGGDGTIFTVQIPYGSNSEWSGRS
jgi:signal transduction histidine kinase